MFVYVYCIVSPAPSSPVVGVQVEQGAEAGSLAVSWVAVRAARGGLHGYRVRAAPALDALPGNLPLLTTAPSIH